MNLTSYDKGILKGREEGREEERRQMLQEQLEERFGVLPLSAIDRLHQLGFDELRVLAKSILHAESLAELGLGDTTA